MDKNAVIAEATKAYEPERKGIMNRIYSWVRENPDTVDAIKIGAGLAVVAGIVAVYAGHWSMEDAAYQAYKAGISWKDTLPPGVGEWVYKTVRGQQRGGYDIDITTALAHFHQLPAYAMAKAGGFAAAVAGAVALPATALLQMIAEDNAPKKPESAEEIGRKEVLAERGTALEGLEKIHAAVKNAPSSVDVEKLNAQLAEILKEVRHTGTAPELNSRPGPSNNSNLSVNLATIAVLGSMG